MFDSVQVRFKHTKHWPSPFANTREVPFVESYLTVLKSIIDDINTEYFWFFANFMDLKTVDIDYIPEQHEKDQIHVWYNTHPLGGTNKEGNVFLIPTKAFKIVYYRSMDPIDVLLLISDLEGSFHHSKRLGFAEDAATIREICNRYYKLYFKLCKEQNRRPY